MATVSRAIHCELGTQKPVVLKAEPMPVPVQRVKASDGKILLQPRVCTLRSYGSDRAGVMKTKRDGGDDASTFFETLSKYIESSKRSHDFEIISGRLAMIVFAATVTTEMVTGNSLFRKMDLQGIAEALGLCLGVMPFAAIFAWLSNARNRVGSIFTISCNTFIDSLIDQIVDGLFHDIDWSDEI
ncbi:hypothetical protein CFOL_v3_06522 [Cephalotus follicularis]|uniref:Chloroa_b-bind domain-containing protein n=1 Tax=Cephalotus follicularis TaxID=3775 RepID=A0A1Q3B4W0_CEPFO|nr:hypothetical protein CFOL_v3_06522 [Cephalotus follicularis]